MSVYMLGAHVLHHLFHLHTSIPEYSHMPVQSQKVQWWKGRQTGRHAVCRQGRERLPRGNKRPVPKGEGNGPAPEVSGHATMPLHTDTHAAKPSLKKAQGTRHTRPTTCQVGWGGAFCCFGTSPDSWQAVRCEERDEELPEAEGREGGHHHWQHACPACPGLVPMPALMSLTLL